MVAFDAVLWSPRPSRTPRKIFNSAKNTKAWSSYSFNTGGPTNTRQGGLQSKNRDFQPSMFSVGGERCPVALFKQFVERRPLNMQWSVPFYLSIKRNRRLNDNIWFKTQPMVETTSSNMMKTIVAGTSLEESHKKFTNHSSRKTTVSKLKTANIERSDIVQVTGHRSVQSLDDYDEADEKEQRRLSSAISRRNYNPSAMRKSEWQFATSEQLWLQSLLWTWMCPYHTLASPSMTVSKKKKTISAIISRFSSSEFLRESNHDEVSGTLTMLNTFNNCRVSLSSVAARRELLRFQNGSVVLVNAELSLSRMIFIERLLLLIILKRVFFTEM